MRTANRRLAARSALLAAAIGLAAGCGSSASALKPPVAGTNANNLRSQIHKELADAISTSNPSVDYSMSDDSDTSCADNQGRLTGQLALGIFVDVDNVPAGQGAVIMDRLAAYWRKQGGIVASTPAQPGQNSPFSAQLADMTVSGGVDNKGQVHLRAATKCVAP